MMQQFLGGLLRRNAASSHRVRTPTVLQMEAVECGAAALAIVMGYYKKFVPLEELRVACGVSRDGSKASNVVKAARTYGLEARGYRKEPEQVRSMTLPLIVFWNFNHFLVVEGFRKGLVYLNDPASGPRTVSEEEFDLSFTGVVLEIKPGPDFKPGGEARSVLKSLRWRLQGSKSALAYLVIAGLALVIPGLVVPIFTKIFVDDFLVARLDHWIKPLLIGMAVTAVIRGALTWLQQYALLRLYAKLSLTWASQFFWHVLRLPINFFNQRSPGEIGSRVAINDSVASLMSGELASAVLAVFLAGFYALLMAFYDPLLTSLGVSMAILNIVFLRIVSRKRTDISQKLAMDQGKLLGTSMNGLRMIETLKASGMESDFFAKWSGYQTKVLNGQQNGLSVLFIAVPPLLTAITTVAVLGVGGLRVMDGHMTMGMLVAFQSLMAGFLAPVTQLVSLGSQIQEMRANINRLDDVRMHPRDPLADTSPDQEAAANADLAKLDSYLELRDVSFGYSPLEAPLIENFNLKLNPGSRIALVGPSGCGKSTISKLVMGLYQPWSGEILFDGKPRSSTPRHVLVNSLGMVDQDIALFEGTVRDNLTMWDTTIAEHTVIEAARDALIHDVISSRPGGYDSPMLEGAANFSGGQRQRLEIARMLALNPTLIVLDEATSALDPVTEANIDDNLRRRGCTCLIVAHRLSTIRDCDEIIVMDKGKVTQRGTHEELLEHKEGLYARLVYAA